MLSGPDELHAAVSIAALVIGGTLMGASYGMQKGDERNLKKLLGSGMSRAEKKKLEARTKKEAGLRGEGQGIRGGPSGRPTTIGAPPTTDRQPRLLGRSGD